MSAEKKKHQRPDWDAIYIHYRAGIKSLREIGAEFGVAAPSIHKHAKKNGWTQDLSAKIHAKAEALVNAEVANTEAANSAANAKNAVSQQAVVDANAQAIYQVRIGHRKGLTKLIAIKDKLLNSLEAVVDNLPELAEVIEMVRQPDERGMDKANDALRRAMDRSTVIEDLKKLAEVDEKVRKGEREAFGITNDADSGETAVDSILKKINEAARGTV